MGIEFKTNSTSNDIIFLLALILLLGCFLKQLTSIKKLPYTPFIMLLGTILGLLAPYLGSTLGGALETWSQITPEAFLLALIPPLIFGVAFSCDWEIIRNELGQIIILSTLGVGINAFIIGLLFKYALNYEDFSLAEAFTLGGVLSATDPVTISEVLKFHGTRRKLTTLIEGEAILNDGTAMICVEMCVLFTIGGNGSDMAWELLASPLGGFLLGGFIGVVLTYFMLKLFKSSVVIIALTICSAYLTFYSAQMTALGLSGVIAVSTFGLYLSSKKHAIIFSNADAAVKEFWNLASYFSETFIFVIIGIVLGNDIVEDANLTAMDWIKHVALYFSLHLARLATLLLLWPLMKLYGDYNRIRWRQIIMLMLSGQRGGMALALALVISRAGYFSESVTTQILFHTAGTSFLTIVVNGILAEYLLEILNLARAPQIKDKVYLQLLRGLSATGEDSLEKLRDNRSYKRVNWGVVHNLTSMDLISERIKKIERELKGDIERSPLEKIEAEKEARFHFLNTLKSVYWHYNDEHQASGYTVRLLQECTDHALDDEDFPIPSWNYLARYLTGNWYLKIVKAGTKIPVLGRVFQKWLLQHLAECYEIAATYISAHAEAQVAVADVVYDREIMNQIVAKVTSEIKMAREYIKNGISTLYPEVAAAVDSKRVSLQIIKDLRGKVREYMAKGLLPAATYEEIMDVIETAVYALLTHPPQVPLPQPKEEVKNCQLLKNLIPEEEWESILDRSREIVLNADEVLFDPSKPCSEIYVIIKGKIAERLDPAYVKPNWDETYLVTQKAGRVLGLYEMLTNALQYYTKTVARSMVVVLAIPMEEIMGCMNTPDKELEVWNHVAPNVIKLHFNNFMPFHDLQGDQLAKLMSMCREVITEPTGKIDITDGIILMHGEANKVLISGEGVLKQAEKYSGCCMVQPVHGLLDSISKCVVYKLPGELRDMWGNDKMYHGKISMWITNHQLKEKLNARAYSLPRVVIGSPKRTVPFIRRESGIIEEALNMQLDDNPDQTHLYPEN